MMEILKFEDNCITAKKDWETFSGGMKINNSEFYNTLNNYINQIFTDIAIIIQEIKMSYENEYEFKVVEGKDFVVSGASSEDEILRITTENGSVDVKFNKTINLKEATGLKELFSEIMVAGKLEAYDKLIVKGNSGDYDHAFHFNYEGIKYNWDMADIGFTEYIRSKVIING